MDKNSKPNFIDTLNSYRETEALPKKLIDVIEAFYESYQETLSSEEHLFSEIDALFKVFIERIKENYHHPYQFSPYHKMIRKPFDYFKFGVDFLRLLVNKNLSSVLGKEHLNEILNHLNSNHNVIFFANHQTEADPQAISLLLEKDFPTLPQKMIFVAGERVITDPLAIPFSMGCNLLCIYSKRYINFPPQKKYEKQLHNKKIMRLMGELLKEGGKCIYVAPSGGRDRRNEKGEIEIAPFDPQSIEMFYLMAKKSKTPTFFYPMTLGTYELLPPPEKVQLELGEIRSTKKVGIHLAIGPSIDMENYPNSNHSDKNVRRKSRSDYIWELVKKDYSRFQGE